MKKFLLIVEKKKDTYRAEGVLNSMNIKYEKIWPDRYNIWTTDEKAKHLNDTFEYMACIRTEL